MVRSSRVVATALVAVLSVGALPSGVAAQDPAGGDGSAPEVDSSSWAGGADGDPWIDTWDRATVVAEYEAEFKRVEPDPEFTGDLDECVAGTTSQAYRDSELQRVNWFRRMAGLELAAENATYSADAQHAALMMAAEGRLTHRPGPTWECYSAQGAYGARSSNLAFTRTGIEAITAYMRDDGISTTSVGHRRWVLSPYVQEIGMGDAFNSPDSPNRTQYHTANALFVIGALESAGRIREARDFVAWPPPGYAPAYTTWKRWSFNLYGSADFSAAEVNLTSDTGVVPIEVVNRDGEDSGGYGGIDSRALVWEIAGIPDWPPMAEPTDGDECYTVTISGVRVGGVVQTPFEYVTCLLDLSVESPVVTRPVAPENLEVTDIGHDSVTLSWTLSPQPEGVAVNGYVVERLDGADWVEVHRSATAITTYSPGGLEPSTGYTFRIRLETTRGAASASVMATTVAAPTIAISGDVEIRVVARRLPLGRAEFALQQRLDGEWSRRHVPTQRFFPTVTRAGQWLISSPVAVSVESASTGGEVRILAQRLANGKIEFGLQGLDADGWGERVLPQQRLLPTTAQIGEWLLSTPVTLSVATAEDLHEMDPAPPGRPRIDASGGTNAFSASWGVDGSGSEITAWQVTIGRHGTRFPAGITNHRWSNQDAGEYTIRIRACNDTGCGPEGTATVTVSDP